MHQPQTPAASLAARSAFVFLLALCGCSKGEVIDPLDTEFSKLEQEHRDAGGNASPQAADEPFVARVRAFGERVPGTPQEIRALTWLLVHGTKEDAQSSAATFLARGLDQKNGEGFLCLLPTRVDVLGDTAVTLLNTCVATSKRVESRAAALWALTQLPKTASAPDGASPSDPRRRTFIWRELVMNYGQTRWAAYARRALEDQRNQQQRGQQPMMPR